MKERLKEAGITMGIAFVFFLGMSLIVFGLVGLKMGW